MLAGARVPTWSVEYPPASWAGKRLVLEAKEGTLIRLAIPSLANQDGFSRMACYIRERLEQVGGVERLGAACFSSLIE